MTKFVKVVLICVLCFISFYIGWGYGQQSTYTKVMNSPSLMKQLYGEDK